MNSQPAHRYTPDDIRDFQTVNKALAALRISVLHADAHSQMLAVGDPAKLADALNEAPNNPMAHSYLVKCVDRLLGSDQAGFEPQPGPDVQPTSSEGTAAGAPGRGNVHNIADHRDQQKGSRAAGDEARTWVQHHVYGKKASVCFQEDRTSNGDITLSIQAAECVGDRKYDWKNKINIQCTRDEMPAVAAVIFGLAPNCEFSNHGPQNNKGFKIENQQGKIFVQVRAPQRSLAVPVGPGDAYAIGALVLRQLRKQHPQIASMADAVALIRHTYLRLSSPRQ